MTQPATYHRGKKNYGTGYDMMARIDELEAKLAKAEWLLCDASVQLREGRIKTRRNRADLIDSLLAELKGETDE